MSKRCMSFSSVEASHFTTGGIIVDEEGSSLSSSNAKEYND